MVTVSTVKIHDTTLRDGEQMPGVVMRPEDKLLLAEKMVDFGVDIIDIMPVVSEEEAKVTKELVALFGDRISATCRIKKSDVDIASASGARRVTLFAPLSDLHIQEKLRITREENLRRTLDMADYCSSLGLAVDFAAEDAGRATFDYFVEFLSALDGRVKVFFIADTVGCLTPDSASKIVSYVKEHFRCPIGLHFHNDFGMATANTLSGIMAGADYFSGTFTGIGERSGNAAIEEVVAALKFLHERDIGVKYSMLKEICDAVQAASKVIVQKHKPVIGVNAFAHESGVHVDGILKNARTYEFYDPAEVGNERKIVLGKHSGGSALRHFLHENFSGSGPLPDDFEAIMKNIKILYQKETKGPAGEVFA